MQRPKPPLIPLYFPSLLLHYFFRVENLLNQCYVLKCVTSPIRLAAIYVSLHFRLRSIILRHLPLFFFFILSEWNGIGTMGILRGFVTRNSSLARVAHIPSSLAFIQSNSISCSRRLFRRDFLKLKYVWGHLRRVNNAHSIYSAHTRARSRIPNMGMWTGGDYSRRMGCPPFDSLSDRDEHKLCCNAGASADCWSYSAATYACACPRARAAAARGHAIAWLETVIKGKAKICAHLWRQRRMLIIFYFVVVANC